MNRWRAPALLLLIALGFVASGLLFIPRLGIEVDEALVANGIYPHGAPWYSWHAGQDEIPVMLLSYVGAIKTWFYNGLFLITPPRPLSLRVPTLLLAAGTLFLFFALLNRTIGRRAAWIATLLLATDTAYLLMNAIDYGPVTLQFVFKLSAMLLLIRFHQQGERAALAGAFFLLGLAMWDKANFAWVLMGFAAGALAVFPREIRSHFTPRNLAVAIPAMLLGALPLVIFNLARPLETFRSTARVESLAVWGKYVVLTRSIDGSVFGGFLTAADSGPTPGEPNHFYQSAAIAISRALGHPQHNFTLWATIGAFLSLSLLWRTRARRPILFALIASLFTWLPMVLTAGAGAAAQHVLLIWPLHFIAIAAAVDRLPSRADVIALAALLCVSNVIVTTRNYANLIVNGPSLRWTDAMDPLHRALLDLHARRIYVADWGLIETMNLLSEGELPMYPAGTDPVALHAALADQGAVFVAHPPQVAEHPNELAALDAAAQQHHYTKEPIATIRDRNGRPAFDVFRFRKLPL